jgi:hypothetical protein
MTCLGDDMGADCVDCDQTRVVYEFFSVHVLCGQQPLRFLAGMPAPVYQFSYFLHRCFKSSHGRELSCVRIHRCGAEIIGNYALLLDTAILRDKLELISINNPPPLRVGVNNSSQTKL